MHVHYKGSMQSIPVITERVTRGQAQNRMVKLLQILWLIAGPMGSKYREPVPSGALRTSH
jgi:hypothetical protein